MHFPTAQWGSPHHNQCSVLETGLPPATLCGWYPLPLRPPKPDDHMSKTLGTPLIISSRHQTSHICPTVWHPSAWPKRECCHSELHIPWALRSVPLERVAPHIWPWTWPSVALETPTHCCRSCPKPLLLVHHVQPLWNPNLHVCCKGPALSHG